MRSQIVLLTDFGNKDGYHSIMKGVIKSIVPNASIIDLTHEISPQNIEEAAFVIWNAFKYFPRNTVFVCVVDPGVGSKRKILLVKTKEYIFLAPDNGILKYIFSSLKIIKIYNVENKEYFLKDVSNTFHGRDIFAPVAANILKGVPLRNFGKVIEPETKAEYFVAVSKNNSKVIEGKVIYVDRFGNIITNFAFDNVKLLEFLKYVKIGRNKVTNFYRYYSQGHSSEPFGLIGSRNLLELSVLNASAVDILKAKIGTPIKLYLR